MTSMASTTPFTKLGADTFPKRSWLRFQLRVFDSLGDRIIELHEGASPMGEPLAVALNLGQTDFADRCCGAWPLRVVSLLLPPRATLPRGASSAPGVAWEVDLQ